MFDWFAHRLPFGGGNYNPRWTSYTEVRRRGPSRRAPRGVLKRFVGQAPSCGVGVPLGAATMCGCAVQGMLVGKSQQEG